MSRQPSDFAVGDLVEYNPLHPNVEGWVVVRVVEVDVPGLRHCIRVESPDGSGRHLLDLRTWTVHRTKDVGNRGKQRQTAVGRHLASVKRRAGARESHAG